MRVLAVLLIVLATALAAGCGGDDDDGEEAAPVATQAETTAAEEDPCAPEQLELASDGKLTIGTDNPAYPPWFGGAEKAPWKISDPTSGEGFESAVAYAVAEELGFDRADVEWKVVPFNQSFKPGPKDFDFDINQISITDERKNAVDFSDGYYDVNQALVSLEGSELAGATTHADLKDAKLGAQIGTTSLQYIQETIEPSQDPSVYDTSNDVITALKAKQIDGIVVDLPTAFYIVAAELDGGVIVGQFPAAEGEQEQFGMVFEKGSPLVSCVNEAIQTLKDGGELADIQQEWLSDKASAPVIQ
jgi:polar amino acid transport system substrate-binding protein